jgi:aspartate ammonia-lyase
MIANVEAYKAIREVAHEKTDLSEEELDKLLDARKMTEARRTASSACLMVG